MSRGTSKSLSDKDDNESDDSDSSIESISSSSWKIESNVEKNKPSPCPAKVVNISDSSSECSEGAYEAKVLSYLSGISIQENIKTKKKSLSKPKKEVDYATSSSWESDNSLQPSFRYSSRTVAKKKIWETLERSMEEDNKMRRTKKLKKRIKPKTSPEKVPNQVYVDAGLERNVAMQQIQIAHLSGRQQNCGQMLDGNNVNSDLEPIIINDNTDRESAISEWFCEICNFNFETKSLLNSHMVNKHEGFVTSQEMDLSQGCHIKDLSQECHIKDLSRGCHIKDLSQGCHIEDLSQGCHIKDLSQGCHIKDLPQGTRICHKDEQHIRIVHSGTNFKCEICGKCYQNRFTLGTHMKKHTGEFDVFTCMTCSQKFHRKQLMVDHVGDLNTKCLWCDMVLGCRTKLLAHIDEKHRSSGRLECTECRRDVHSLTKFWNHLIVYHPEQCRLVNKNCLVCEKCRQLCSSRHHLKKHQRKLCLVSDKNVCKHCNIRFGTNYLHGVHLKKVLRCPMCGTRFECLTLLKEHVYFGHGACSNSNQIVSKNSNPSKIFNKYNGTTGCTVSDNEKRSETSKISNFCDENSNETISKNVETACMESINSGLPSKSIESSRISSSNDGELSSESSDNSSVREWCSLISNNYTKVLDFESGDYINMPNLSINSSAANLYKYKCYDCDSYYQRLQDLECHRRLAHDSDDNSSPDIMFCDHCGKQFTKRSLMKGHFRKSICSICGSEFKCWLLLSFHCTSQHKIGEWTCDKCSRRFRTSVTLVKHARSCIGMDVRKHRRKRKFVENLRGEKFVKHSKYKRIRILDDETDDESCNTDVSTSGISLKNTSSFRIVLKKRKKKVSPSNFKGSLRKSPRKRSKLSPTKNVVKPSKKSSKTTPKKNVNDFLKLTYELTPVKCNLFEENNSKFVIKNCKSSSRKGSSNDVLKPTRKNGELSSDDGDFIENNVSKSFKRNYESPTDKKLKIRNGVLKSERNLTNLFPKKDFTKIENINSKILSSPKEDILKCNDDFKLSKKLNNLFSKNNYFQNIDLKPTDSTLETSKDLIIDTSISCCQSDNNDSFTKNEQKMSDCLLVEKHHTDKNLTEVTRTDFFLNLDLVSSTPIDGHRKNNGDLFHGKEGFDGSITVDCALKDTKNFCRQLNLCGDVDTDNSKIVNFEDSPKRMPTSILKSVSSAKYKATCKRIVHFEDDLEKDLSWKFLKRQSPDGTTDSSRSVVEVASSAKTVSCMSSSSKSQNLQHIFQSSNNRSQIYRCRLCKKRFTSKDLLQSHVSSNVCMLKISNLK